MNELPNIKTQKMKTAAPPIELIKHFFTNVHIDANATDFNRIYKNEPLEYNIDSEISTLEVAGDDKKLFQVTLKVVIYEKENLPLAYKVSITTVGLVRIDPIIPIEKHLGHATNY
jgi:hypothetical protein